MHTAAAVGGGGAAPWIADINNLQALLEKEIGAVATNLNNEIARAQAAESTLTTNLNNEIGRAMSAENTLTTNLNNEIGARKAGDADTLSSAKSYTDQQITQNAANSPMSANPLCNPSTGTANTKFMILTGENQGIIKGDINQNGKLGDIGILAICQVASRPFDPTTGQLTGPNAYQPITIIKTTDRASPQLYQALVTGEKLSAKIEFFRTNEKGEEFLFQTITFTDALITSIKEVKVDTADKQNINHFGEYEQISFTFQKIDIENNDGKTSFIDDWSK